LIVNFLVLRNCLAPLTADRIRMTHVTY